MPPRRKLKNTFSARLRGLRKSEDTWYARKPDEVMLCRYGERTDIGGYHAFWRFREKDGEVIVTESYAWQYIVAD
jgi:hypothetical protein